MSIKQAAQSIRGFTLIELLVVIVIIGILATGAMSVFTSAQAKARDSQRITDLKAIESGLIQYYSDADEYPADAGVTNFKGKLSDYVSRWPKDPKNTPSTGYQYVYCVAPANSGILQQEYALATRLERSQSARGSSLADLTVATSADAQTTYVIGNAELFTSAGATKINPAACGGTITGGTVASTGSVISN